MALLSEIYDDFNLPGLDLSKWTHIGTPSTPGLQFSTSYGMRMITPSAGFFGVRSKLRGDFMSTATVGRNVYVEIGSSPTTTTSQCGWYVFRDANVEQYGFLRIYQSGAWRLKGFRQDTAGDKHYLFDIPWSGTTHRWQRLSHTRVYSGSTGLPRVYFSTSPDGSTWTTRGYTATVFTNDNMGIGFTSGLGNGTASDALTIRRVNTTTTINRGSNYLTDGLNAYPLGAVPVTTTVPPTQFGLWKHPAGTVDVVQDPTAPTSASRSFRMSGAASMVSSMFGLISNVDFKASVRIQTTSGINPYVMMMWRCNAAMTTYYFLRITPNALVVGYWKNGLGTDIMSVPTTASPGTFYNYQAVQVGTDIVVTRNGAQILRISDSNILDSGNVAFKSNDCLAYVDYIDAKVGVITPTGPSDPSTPTGPTGPGGGTPTGPTGPIVGPTGPTGPSTPRGPQPSAPANFRGPIALDGAGTILGGTIHKGPILKVDCSPKVGPIFKRKLGANITLGGRIDHEHVNWVNGIQVVDELETILDSEFEVLAFDYAFGNGLPAAVKTCERDIFLRLDFTGESMADIQNETRLEDLEYLLEDMAAFQDTIYLAPFYDMNANMPWSIDYVGTEQSMTTSYEDFIETWRYLYSKIKAAAPNVQFVFAVAAEDYGTQMEDYYPGHEFVDFLGVSGFNDGKRRDYSVWRGHQSIFQNMYARLKDVAPKKKMWITATGTVDPVYRQALFTSRPSSGGSPGTYGSGIYGAGIYGVGGGMSPDYGTPGTDPGDSTDGQNYGDGIYGENLYGGGAVAGGNYGDGNYGAGIYGGEPVTVPGTGGGGGGTPGTGGRTYGEGVYGSGFYGIGTQFSNNEGQQVVTSIDWTEKAKYDLADTFDAFSGMVGVTDIAGYSSEAGLATILFDTKNSYVTWKSIAPTQWMGSTKEPWVNTSFMFKAVEFQTGAGVDIDIFSGFAEGQKQFSLTICDRRDEHYTNPVGVELRGRAGYVVNAVTTPNLELNTWYRVEFQMLTNTGVSIGVVNIYDASETTPLITLFAEGFETSQVDEIRYGAMTDTETTAQFMFDVMKYSPDTEIEWNSKATWLTNFLKEPGFPNIVGVVFRSIDKYRLDSSVEAVQAWKAVFVPEVVPTVVPGPRNPQVQPCRWGQVAKASPYEYVYWENDFGDVLNLMPTYNDIKLINMEPGSPVAREYMEDRPLGDGSIDYTRFHGSKSVAFNVKTRRTGLSAANVFTDYLARWLVPGRSFRMIYKPRGAPERFVNLVGRGMPKTVDSRGIIRQELVFSCEAPDGGDYDTQLYSLKIPANTSGWVLTHGSLRTEPVGRLHGPLVNPLVYNDSVAATNAGYTLTNAVGLASTIAEGEFIELDFKNRKAWFMGLRDQSANRFADLTIQEWFILDGQFNNSIRLQADSGTGYLELFWRDKN
jgi:hypothetical protein